MGLGSLPVELLESLGPFCGYSQLAHLARLNHSFHAIFNPILYKHNAADVPWHSCLHWAVEHDSLPTLKLGLTYGADINNTGAEVESYIWLLSELPSPRSDNSTYATPLHLAIFKKCLDIVRWLLDNGARLDVPSYLLCRCHVEPRQRPDHLWYPLHYAICHSSNEILRLVLERGDVYSAKDSLGLRCAIEMGSLSAVDALVKHDKFDPNYRDDDNLTALHYVADCENPQAACAIVDKLAQHGVPLDVLGEYGGTALEHLVQQAKFKPAITLLQHGADPNVSDSIHRGLGMIDRCFDEDYAEALEMAEPSQAQEMRDTRLELLKLLIAGGVDVNRRLGHGRPPFSRPLFWALIVSKDARCVKVMLDAGASIKDAVVERYEDESECILAGFFDLFGELDTKRPRLWDRIEKDLEPYKESVSLLLERGARIDSIGDERSALGKACEIEQETGALTFLVQNATSGNTELEYVASLRERYSGNEVIHGLLDRFYDKLLAEVK
ncbi:hypothetical protein FDECE_12260 [Fusarium decemcellulare]|nr:hypothetical protein FDECE_12260 [Fusarium decemcellulare]